MSWISKTKFKIIILLVLIIATTMVVDNNANCLDWKKFKVENEEKVKSIDNKEELIKVRFNIAISMANLGQVQQAHEIFNRLEDDISLESFYEIIGPDLDKLEINPDDLLALNYAAFMKIFEKDYEDSIHYFKRIIHLNPSNVWTYNYLAASYIQTGNNDKAEQYLLKARQLKENQYTSFLLGIIHYRQGSYLKALKEFSNSGDIVSTYIIDE